MNSKNKKGKIVIITGPSGVGKTTVAQGLLKNKNLNLKKVITCTTRSKRPRETEGKDYFFLTKKEFLKNIKNKEMFEYAEVYGNYCGSRKKDVKKILNSGGNVLFVIDVQGAFNLKNKNPESKAIFLGAENTDELKERLLKRKTDSRDVIKKRVDTALEELKLADKLDYTVTNKKEKLQETINKIKNIIRNINKKEDKTNLSLD